MKVTHNGKSKTAEFYISREKKNRKAPIYMGGVSGRLNPQGSFLGVFVSILFLS
jgi:hypothetical protein